MNRFGSLIVVGMIWSASIVPTWGTEISPLCGPLPAVVATVDGDPIAKSAVLLRLNTTNAGSCRQALDEAVRSALVRRHAETYRLELDASAVRRAVDEFRKDFPSDEKFSEFLAERNASEADLDWLIEDRQWLRMVEERQIRSWVFADDLQEEYFAQHRSELAKDRAKVRHILVKTREEAERIRREMATRDRTLADLAGTYSLDEKTRDQGGDLGWIERGAMPPSFDKAVYSLGFGTVSAPVQTPLGWHLIRVEDRKPAADQTLEDHRPRVIRLLQEEEWSLQRESWWDDLRHQVKVWIAPELAGDAEMVHAE